MFSFLLRIFFFRSDVVIPEGEEANSDGAEVEGVSDAQRSGTSSHVDTQHG